MLFYSTRNTTETLTGPQAVAKGIAADGGLYVPAKIPPLPLPLEELLGKSYGEIAFLILHTFFDELDESALREAVDKAYDNKYEKSEIAPVVKKGDMHFLELFHGPTLAFKDMALCILPALMKMSLEQLGQRENIVILTATSGDTGKAALEGFKNQEGIDIIVFYPRDGVSEMQKLQMTTEDGENCFVAAVEGNFDDAQTGVKALFADEKLNDLLREKGYSFSSANSINIGRLIPQIAYYVHGYLTLVNQGEIRVGDTVNVSVPTGNFGNILAAFFAREMGLPIGKFICASNENNVLFDFFTQGVYDKNRPFYTTTSPSMDILVSSNLERLLFFAAEGDTQKVNTLMANLNLGGRYKVDEGMWENLRDFYPGYATKPQVDETIRELFEKTGYLIDTHTAVAVKALGDYREQTGDLTPCLIASTASPFKFSESVCEALGIGVRDMDFYECATQLASVANVTLPKSLEKLKTATVRFGGSYSKDKMRDVVCDFLHIAEGE